MSQTSWMWVKATCVIAPIVVLLAAGLLLTLRSGLVDLRKGSKSWTLVGNFSKTVLALTGSIALIAVLQELIGFPRDMWR